MFGGGHQVQMSSGDPTSPPQGTTTGKGIGTKLVGGSVAMDANQLKARLFASSEIHSSNRPQLRVARRRRSKTDEVHHNMYCCIIMYVTLCVASSET